MKETWYQRDLPVLTAVVEVFETEGADALPTWRSSQKPLGYEPRRWHERWMPSTENTCPYENHERWRSHAVVR